MSVLEHPHHPVVSPVVDERDGRATLRLQIARLERELLTQATGAYPVLPVPQRPGPARGPAPRLLTLGELERTRDELAERVRELTLLRCEHDERQREARELLERMLLAPGEHRWTRVCNDDLGEPGCRHFHVVPRLGPIGMLAGWWHVKVSSGCPLAWGRSDEDRPAPMSQSKRARKKARQARRGGPRPQPAPLSSPEPTPAEPANRVQRPKGRIDRMLDKADARPKPPWHPVPLVEISVLAGIVLLVLGFLNYESSNGRLAIGAGLVLASLAGLDTAAREHFAGYRSHSSLLAGLPAVGTVALLALLGPPLWVALLAAAAVFALLFWLGRRAFRKRAGVSFKV